MSRAFAQALWFSAPVLLAGLVHVAVIRLGWFAPLARLPLDGGRTLRGRRLFGANKTLRGALIMTCATVLAVTLLAWLAPQLHPRLAVCELQAAHPSLWGLLLGVGYVLGELPNSFIKRQLDIAPGASARNGWRPLAWLADQTDSVFGIFLVLFFAWRPDALFVALVLLITLVLHPAVAGLMVVLNLKDRVG